MGLLLAALGLKMPKALTTVGAQGEVAATGGAAKAVDASQLMKSALGARRERCEDAARELYALA